MTTKRSYGIPSIGLDFTPLFEESKSPEGNRYLFATIVAAAVLRNQHMFRNLEKRDKENSATEIFERVVFEIVEQYVNGYDEVAEVQQDVKMLVEHYGIEEQSIKQASKRAFRVTSSAVFFLTDFLIENHFVFFRNSAGRYYYHSDRSKSYKVSDYLGEELAFAGVSPRDGSSEIRLCLDAPTEELNSRPGYDYSAFDLYDPAQDRFFFARHLRIFGQNAAFLKQEQQFECTKKRKLFSHELARFVRRDEKALRRWEGVSDFSGVLDKLLECAKIYKDVYRLVHGDFPWLRNVELGNLLDSALYACSVFDLKTLKEHACEFGEKKVAQLLVGSFSAEKVADVIAKSDSEIDWPCVDRSWPIDWEHVELIQEEGIAWHEMWSGRLRTSCPQVSKRELLERRERRLQEEAEQKEKDLKWEKELKEFDALKQKANKLLAAINETIENPITGEKMELPEGDALDLLSDKGIEFSSETSAIIKWSNGWTPNSREEVPRFGPGRIVARCDNFTCEELTGNLEFFAARDGGKIVGRIRFVQ